MPATASYFLQRRFSALCDTDSSTRSNLRSAAAAPQSARHSVHTSVAHASTPDPFGDPYAGIDSWSGSGGSTLGGRGPRLENQGIAALPPPPPDYQTALQAGLNAQQSPQFANFPSSPTSSGIPTSTSLQASSPPTTASPPSTSRPRRQSVEDPLSALGRYDIAFLVDDSPSMNDGTLWSDLRTALMGIVEKSAKYDKDGVDVCFMNEENIDLRNCTTMGEVARVFDQITPSGSTPTAMRMDDLLRPYIEMCEDAKAAKQKFPKPLIVVVITDGRADDPDSLKDAIIEFAGRLDEVRAPPFQLGIQFLQIGNDPDAATFLRELDDEIKAENSVRDMIDTVTFQGRFTTDFVLQVLLGSVNRRIDDRR